LRGINGNVCFTIINFFLFKHSPYFFITPCINEEWENQGQGDPEQGKSRHERGVCSTDN